MSDPDPIEEFIRETFEDNFQDLRRNSGHALSPAVKQIALQQVLFYWQKLRTIAESITQTEVKLHLPNQKTPGGRRFSIEGVVDIVRANDRVVMYDIKTHEADAVRENPQRYEEQLNVYAHIWKHLRGQDLDETAIIAMGYPIAVREAIANHDQAALVRALVKWVPVVNLPLVPEHVDAMIENFARIVDAIEESEFAPAPLERLKERRGKTDRNLFATVVCGNCDARFSCSSYRAYAISAGGRVEKTFQAYYSDLGTDAERDEWTTNTLAAAADAPTLADII